MITLDRLLGRKSGGKQGGSPADGLAGRMAWLGALTLTVQVLVLREVFSCFYGSEIAVAYALAVWTLAAGLGALAGGGGIGRPKRPAMLRAALPLAALACVLGVRAWGAQEVLGLRDYGILPVFVAPCALLGGLLFSWQLRENSEPGEAGRGARGYAWETAGGIYGALVVSVYLYFGGGSVPLLILLAGMALAAHAGRGHGLGHSAAGAGLGFLVAVGIAGSGVLDRLDRETLRLHYPGYRVLAHRDTPFASLTAVERKQARFVFRNGLPLPPPGVTRRKLAAAAFLAQFPRAWRRAFFVQPISAGFGRTVCALYRGIDIGVWEADRQEFRFLVRWLDPGVGKFKPYLGASPWRRRRSVAADLIAVFAALPGSFSENRFLTREFFRAARKRLASGGVLAVLIPAAPGYTHPRLNRVYRSVRKALDAEFPYCREFPTDLGMRILVAGDGPLNSRFVPERFGGRLGPAADSGVAGEMAEIFLNARLRSGLFRPPPGAEPVRANSMVFPAACFDYLKFRGAMIETAAGFWDRVLRFMPRAAAITAILFLLAALGVERKKTGAGRLFWASWLTTMALTASLYLAQGILGQAYWLMALLSAASMTGICLAASIEWMSWNARRGAVLYSLFVPSLFLAWPVFASLRAPVLVGVLCVGNLAMGLRVGALFRGAAGAGDNPLRKSALMFGVDLFGAAAGFLVGGVLMAWWAGLAQAGVFCAVSAMVVELKASASGLLAGPANV